jgi:hypothetical protein
MNPQLFDWRAHLPVHPACAAFPELSRDELITLGNDIKTNGLHLPIVVHADGDASNPEFKLLDGRSRLDAMAAVGIEFNIEPVYCEKHDRTSLRLNVSGSPIGAPGGNVQTARGFSEDEIKALVLSLNAFRRHLDARDKRAAIDAVLKLDPGKSDRQIAEQTGSSPTTVGKRRKKAERAGDVSKMDTRIDTKGRKQPVKKQKISTKEKPGAATIKGDDAAASADAMKAKHAATVEAGQPTEQSDFDLVEYPEQVKVNILDTIGGHRAVARAHKKILKVSSLDRPAGHRGDARHQSPLKSNENFEDDISVSEDVEDPAIVLSNILDSIQRAQSVARAWRKILKLSSFDRGAKKQISDEIDLLIRKWRSVQASLAQPPSPKEPPKPPLPDAERARALDEITDILNELPVASAA